VNLPTLFASAIADGTGAALVFLVQVAALAFLAFIGHLIGRSGCLKEAWLLSTFIAAAIAIVAALTLGVEIIAPNETETAFIPEPGSRLTHGIFVFVCAIVVLGGTAHFSARHAASLRAAANVQWQQERAQTKRAAEAPPHIFQQPPVESSLALAAQNLAAEKTPRPAPRPFGWN